MLTNASDAPMLTGEACSRPLHPLPSAQSPAQPRPPQGHRRAAGPGVGLLSSLGIELTPSLGPAQLLTHLPPPLPGPNPETLPPSP